MIPIHTVPSSNNHRAEKLTRHTRGGADQKCCTGPKLPCVGPGLCVCVSVCVSVCWRVTHCVSLAADLCGPTYITLQCILGHIQFKYWPCKTGRHCPNCPMPGNNKIMYMTIFNRNFILNC